MKALNEGKGKSLAKEETGEVQEKKDGWKRPP
jgi:hypothetical protein